MPKPTAANLAALALLLLHASSLLTIPPLALNVVVTATAIVYLGCRKGLKLLPGAKAKAAKGKSAAPQETVTLSATEAWQFPLYGSLALCGMYALIKVLGKKVLNYILLAYFLGIGLVAVEQLLEAEASRLFKKAARSRKRRGRVVTLPRVLASLAEQTTVDLRLNTLQQICWGITIILMVAYALTKHWLLNNLIASRCVLAASNPRHRVHKTRSTPRSPFCLRHNLGLRHRCYGHRVKSVSRRWLLLTVLRRRDFSMLGLGDVVVPGLAALLRFDTQEARETVLPLYITSVLAGPAALYVMFTFDAAQPLSYLVPAASGRPWSVCAEASSRSLHRTRRRRMRRLLLTVRRRRGSPVRSRRSAPRRRSGPSRRSGPRRRGARHASRRSRQDRCGG